MGGFSFVSGFIVSSFFNFRAVFPDDSSICYFRCLIKE